MNGVLTITGTDAEGKRCLILYLNQTGNAALEKWFTRHRDRTEFAESLDVIYANSDQTLNAMK